jgi:hypothetical protein
MTAAVVHNELDKTVEWSVMRQVYVTLAACEKSFKHDSRFQDLDMNPEPSELSILPTSPWHFVAPVSNVEVLAAN